MSMEVCLKPCSECPFRVKSASGFLGGFSAEETMRTALSEAEFICHKTRGTKNRKLCAGRFLFSANSFKMFRSVEYQANTELVKRLNPNRAKEILDFITFIPHHSKPFMG